MISPKIEVSTIPPKLWITALCFCVGAEGLWLLIAAAIAGAPLALLGLLGLWLLVLLAIVCYRLHPTLIVAAAWLNFLGCALIKTTPYVEHRVFQFFYMHSVDIALVVLAHLLLISTLKVRRFSPNSGQQVK